MGLLNLGLRDKEIAGRKRLDLDRDLYSQKATDSPDLL